MIRVLVAEDSPTARELIVAILRADPEIEVVGVARDGVEAVALTKALHPDLVTMDVHMPRLDGLSATKEIMITVPTPIVIVTGSTVAREVESSLGMLQVGALDVLVKPPNPNAPDFAASARRLVATVKAMAHVKVVRHWRSSADPKAPRADAPPATSERGTGRIVAIATSTGGPAALLSLLSGLPRDFPTPLLIVQHITPGFTTGLASWLQSVSNCRVKVAQHGEPLVPRTAFLAPDDRHLGVTTAATIALSDAPPVGGFRPSGTPLFESVARVYGASSVAVVLTGMGEDGLVGLRAVRAAGGHVIAQDEPSSVIFGMPGAAVAAGVAHSVLDLDAIAPRLATLVKRAP